MDISKPILKQPFFWWQMRLFPLIWFISLPLQMAFSVHPTVKQSTVRILTRSAAFPGYARLEFLSGSLGCTSEEDLTWLSCSDLVTCSLVLRKNDLVRDLPPKTTWVLGGSLSDLMYIALIGELSAMSINHPELTILIGLHGCQPITAVDSG